eukprot:jgi/Mesvir1/24301/Mv10991-RA.1
MLPISASADKDVNSLPLSETAAKAAEDSIIPRQVASSRSYIREIRIRDYALVAEQSVRFVPGLNIITGESGSGKSVLLSALGQLLGAPVDPECVRPPATRALIEGELHVAASHWPAIQRLLEAYPAATASVPTNLGACGSAPSSSSNSAHHPLPASPPSSSSSSAVHSSTPWLKNQGTGNRGSSPAASFSFSSSSPTDNGFSNSTAGGRGEGSEFCLGGFHPRGEEWVGRGGGRGCRSEECGEKLRGRGGRGAGSGKGGSGGYAVGSNVRSICRINGAVVPLKVLRAVGQLLVDVNGQNVQQSLVKEDAQVALLDRFAGTSSLAAQFAELVDRADELAQELHRLDDRMAMDEDQLARMVQEINAINPRVGEDAALRRALQSLDLRRATVEACQRVHSTLTAGVTGDGLGDGSGTPRRGVYTSLRSALNDLSSIDVEALERAAAGGAEGEEGRLEAEEAEAGAPDLDFTMGDPENLVAAADLIEQAQALLRRAEALVEDFATDTPVSDLERDRLLKRSREIERLKLRYRTPSIAALRRAAEEAEQTLAEFASMGQRVEQLEAELQDVGCQLASLGAALSSKRREAAADMCRAVEASLEHLHMSNSRFRVQMAWSPAAVAQRPAGQVQGQGGGGGRYPDSAPPRLQGTGTGSSVLSRSKSEKSIAFAEGADVRWQEREDPDGGEAESEAEDEDEDEASDLVDEMEDGLEDGEEEEEGEDEERKAGEGRKGSSSHWGGTGSDEAWGASSGGNGGAWAADAAGMPPEVDVWGPVENSLLVPGCAPMGEDPGLYYKFGLQGFDKVVFLLAASPSEPLRPLTSVASGGECARIMLALKTMPGASSSDGGLSIAVFDELDSGVGGRIGGRVGVSLHRLCSTGHQVICVTHLPQVAVFANHHVKVSKAMAEDGRMLTVLQELSSEGERTDEIAHMLGLGPSAASELMRNARRDAQEVAAEQKRLEAARAVERAPRFDWTQGVIVKSGTFHSASSAEKGMAAAGGAG